MINKYTLSRKIFLMGLTVMANLSLINNTMAQREDGIKIRFNGFGDITAGQTFGKVASLKADSLFKNFGTDKLPKGTNKGLGIQGLDLVNTVFLNDNLTVQSEINLQVPRGGRSGPSLDVERLYMDYKLSNKFGIQVGQMFTPIGFINRNLYSRAWLMNSVQLFRFAEEESGYVPNHFVGASAYGVFNLNDRHSIKYIAGLGNSLGYAPNENIYARNNGGYQLTGLLEWIIQGPKDFRIGVSGYNSESPTYKGLDHYGDIIRATDSLKINMRHVGFNPYIHYSGKLFDFLAEYHWVSRKSPGTKSSNTNALVVELAYNGSLNGKRLAPYVRYDYIQTPTNNGQYIGVRDLGNGTFGKTYEADLSVIMAGICYDISSFNRLKLEYARYLNGPFQQNAIVVQTAFGF